MTFGEKLSKLRKEKGLSQELLAEQLGTSRQAISKWENHQGFPEIEKLLYWHYRNFSYYAGNIHLVQISRIYLFGIRSRTFRLLLLRRSY